MFCIEGIKRVKKQLEELEFNQKVEDAWKETQDRLNASECITIKRSELEAMKKDPLPLHHLECEEVVGFNAAIDQLLEGKS